MAVLSFLQAGGKATVPMELQATLALCQLAWLILTLHGACVGRWGGEALFSILLLLFVKPPHSVGGFPVAWAGA